MSYLVLCTQILALNFSEMVWSAGCGCKRWHALRTQRFQTMRISLTSHVAGGKTTISRILAKSLNCLALMGGRYYRSAGVSGLPRHRQW
jgi:hypothetical protein